MDSIEASGPIYTCPLYYKKMQLFNASRNPIHYYVISINIFVCFSTFFVYLHIGKFLFFLLIPNLALSLRKNITKIPEHYISFHVEHRGFPKTKSEIGWWANFLISVLIIWGFLHLFDLFLFLGCFCGPHGIYEYTVVSIWLY